MYHYSSCFNVVQPANSSLHLIMLYWGICNCTREEGPDLIIINLVCVLIVLFLCPQVINFVFLFFEAVYYFIPSFWITFFIILYEGLLGGGVYVNAFYAISKQVHLHTSLFIASGVNQHCSDCMVTNCITLNSLTTEKSVENRLIKEAEKPVEIISA